VPVHDDVTTTELLRSAITTFRDLLGVHMERVNRLNVYPVPDGDTGTNMFRTLDAVVAELDGAGADLVSTCDAVAHGALMGARGNSGVIVSQVLRGIAATYKGAGADEPAAVAAAALSAASDAAYQAVLKPIEGTILTVVRESAEAAAAAATGGASLADTLRAARRAGGEALDRTPELLPVLKDAGVVDAGGAGYLLLLDAALHVVAGEPLPDAPGDGGEGGGPSAEALAAVARRASGVGGELDVSEQRYEVMFLCHLADERIDDFKQRWGAIGDSIVVVGGDGIWNCHVHTNDIGAAIEVPLDLDGRPFQIRVTDLFEEVAAEHAARESSIVAGADHGLAETVAAGAAGYEDDDTLPEVACAVVAVSSGPGITALFRQLGVQVVVSGGQTLNPSTAELLDAVARANSNHVVLLPGNKNIIPVAEQVDGLSPKTVRVVPTRSMPEGLAALMAYDPEGDAPGNVVPMRQAADAIAAGEVTRAVRDATTDAGPVREGEWMGIVRGEGIVALGPTALAAAQALLDHLLAGGGELVTVITGVDADDADTEQLQAWLDESHDGVDVEVHAGGQPLYPYLFGVE